MRLFGPRVNPWYHQDMGLGFGKFPIEMNFSLITPGDTMVTDLFAGEQSPAVGSIYFIGDVRQRKGGGETH